MYHVTQRRPILDPVSRPELDMDCIHGPPFDWTGFGLEKMNHIQFGLTTSNLWQTQIAVRYVQPPPGHASFHGRTTVSVIKV